MIESDIPNDAPPEVRYQLANLLMVGETPWFSVHATDAEGDTTSWLISGEWREDRFHFQLQVWIDDAIQALACDAAGQVWAVTVEDDLITHAMPGDKEGWEQLPEQPQVPQPHRWFRRRLQFELPEGVRAELVDCLRWISGSLLIGTFGRRLYRWDGWQAVLEHNSHVADSLGGINDIVLTEHAVFAVGYGGTMLQRDLMGRWLELDGPWPPEGKPFVNLIGATGGPNREVWVIVAGGAVLALRDGRLHRLCQLPDEPLGITAFQGQYFVTTLGGCYQVQADGQATLITRDRLMGRVMATGQTLLAFDAEPQEPGSASVHVWLRTRTAERWFTQVICRHPGKGGED